MWILVIIKVSVSVARAGTDSLHMYFMKLITVVVVFETTVLDLVKMSSLGTGFLLLRERAHLCSLFPLNRPAGYAALEAWVSLIF